jgi:hypothetical protein
MLRQLFGISAKRIGYYWRPINQHAVAIASHATADGQQFKHWFPQVPWKIGDWHVLARPRVKLVGRFKRFQTGRNRQVIDIQ